jgi:hypothetical protein
MPAAAAEVNTRLLLPLAETVAAAASAAMIAEEV